MINQVQKSLFVTTLVATGLLAAMPAWAKSLVLAGGGFKDLTATVYQSNGVTPRAPGTGPAGDPDTVAIYQKIIALAGGSKKIGVITTASDAASTADNGKYYVDALKYYGAGAGTVWIPVTINTSGTACATNNADPTIVNQINSMDGFFVGGGDQSRILTCFFNTSGSTRTDSPIMTALRNRYNAGAVVAGTSAGTAIQAGGGYVDDTTRTVPMITGGESFYALLNGVYSSVNGDNLSADSAGGFGFFKYGALDTHFSERGRQGRIARLGWDTYMNFAFGVDENTALVVTNADTTSASMQAIGQGGVFIFDSRQAIRTGTTSSKNWALSKVITHYLTNGDTFNPTSKTFAPGSGKSTLTGSGALSSYHTFPSATDDVFSSPDNSGSAGRLNPRELAKLSGNLFKSTTLKTYERTFETTSLYKVCLSRSSSLGSQGYKDTSKSSTSPGYVSFKSLVLDFVPSATTCPTY